MADCGSLKALILAAGLGLRARPLSRVRPKPMFPLAGVPLIRLLFEQLRDQGIRRTYVNLHHLGDQIREELKSAMGIHFIWENKLSGSRIIKKIPDARKAPLLVVNGDVFLEIPVDRMSTLFHETGCDGVLLVRRNDENRYAEVKIVGGRFAGRRPKPGPEGWMYCGVALFSPGTAAAIEDESFFTSLENSSLDIRTLEYPGIWLDLGTPRRYFEAESLYRRHQGLPSSRAISVKSRVSSCSRLDRCIVWDDADIAGACRLRDAIVTDGVRISGITGSGCIITRTGTIPLSLH